MSYSGGRKPLHKSPIAMLLIISLLHIWISGRTTAVAAIRMLPAAAEDDHRRISEAPPPKSQTEIFKEYFNSRLNDLNTTTNGTYSDFKRRIPSCPDPLHN